MKTRKTQSGFVRGSRKLALSAFLVLSFAGYALEHDAKAGGVAPAVARVPSTGAPANTTGAPPAATPPTVAPTATEAPAATAAAASAPANAVAPAAPAAPTAEPTATSAPTATTAPAVASNGLKNGTFDGPSVDVQWGLVQVEATIQNGKITNVQFLQYPSDRRTSQRINFQAMPWLQQEALQVQSANVDLITGATLTSEGFAQSLQGALDQARS